MPIKSNDSGNVWVEYSLPQELKDLITNKFSAMMIDELKKVFKYANDKKNIIGILHMNAGTSGVHEAFKNTCNNLGLDYFLSASKLDWYDYDLFMDEVLDTVGKVFYGEQEYEKLCNEFVGNDYDFKK